MRACMCAAVLAAVAGCSLKGANMGEFANTTINVGIVVSDIDRSVAFYKDAIGFTEVEGFDVPASMGGDSGLSNDKPFHVHVLKLADTQGATEIKLIQFPNTPSERPKNEFIHSTLGFRYLTIFVKDTTAAVERLRKAGVTPIAKGPIELPKNLAPGVYLTVVRDPDGNMIEIIGPKKPATARP